MWKQRNPKVGLFWGWEEGEIQWIRVMDWRKLPRRSLSKNEWSFKLYTLGCFLIERQLWGIMLAVTFQWSTVIWEGGVKNVLVVYHNDMGWSRIKKILFSSELGRL